MLSASLNNTFPSFISVVSEYKLSLSDNTSKEDVDGYYFTCTVSNVPNFKDHVCFNGGNLSDHTTMFWCLYQNNDYCMDFDQHKICGKGTDNSLAVTKVYHLRVLRYSLMVTQLWCELTHAKEHSNIIKLNNTSELRSFDAYSMSGIASSLMQTHTPVTPP